MNLKYDMKKKLVIIIKIIVNKYFYYNFYLFKINKTFHIFFNAIF